MTINNPNNLRKYRFDPFLNNLHGWIDSFKFNKQSGQFSVVRGWNKPSLYGICDMIYNLVIPNELHSYIKSHNNEEIDDWISVIKLYQDKNTGWFREGRFNYAYHFKEHSTAFAVSVLKLLNSTPDHDFKISEKLNSRKKVYNWLKKGPEWGLLY
ncbi:MAG: hypothetical protein ACFFHV_00780 [Promethearchaeota archaeon]